MAKSKPRHGDINDATLKIIERIVKKGGEEMALGIPGWRWFQFDTNVDQRYWYVSLTGEVRAGENFRTAKEIQV